MGGNQDVCNFCGFFFKVRQVDASREGGICIIRKGGYPGAWILLFSIQWIHVAMNFSECTDLYMVRYGSFTQNADFDNLPIKYKQRLFTNYQLID